MAAKKQKGDLISNEIIYVLGTAWHDVPDGDAVETLLREGKDRIERVSIICVPGDGFISDVDMAVFRGRMDRNLFGDVELTRGTEASRPEPEPEEENADET